MLEILASSPYVLLLIFLAAILATVVGVVSISLFERQRRNMPFVSTLMDLEDRINRRKSELVEKEIALEEINRKIGARETIAAEIGALEQRRESLLLEMDGLADARVQIDEVKRLAAEAATELAGRQEALEQVRTELENLSGTLSKKQAELAGLEKEINDRKAKMEDIPAGLEARIAELKAEQDTILREVDQLRAERGVLLGARGEVTELTALKAALQNDVEQLKDRLTKLDSDLREAEANHTRILQQTAPLEARLQQFRHLDDKVRSLESRKTAIEEDIERLRSETGDGTAKDAVFDERVLEDLRSPPSVLKTPRSAYRPEGEEQALHGVRQHLLDLNLTYPDRVVKAFHTSLKINDYAQLTVLAGVSGTGKSLLPRRYAEAMGIRFLPFAVEPRWDSPQDLLGFYNYIEKRFRATDLARALVHLDPYNTSGLAAGGTGGQSHQTVPQRKMQFGLTANAPAGQSHHDDMMIVLLDEMNLARVEHYFSEFLSRLEARPMYQRKLEEEERRDAMIPIDIRGRKEGPVRLYPSHNMLFVGTMNDDESTLSLSDKVLDRGNIMQFAAPEDFPEVKTAESGPPPDRRLSFGTWRSWIRQPAHLASGDTSKVRQTIRRLAEIMNNCGRPFGHRLNAAISAYVANYPQENGHPADVRKPLADQIELRIMPKLRGLSIEEHRQRFDELKQLIREDMNDSALAQRLEEIIQSQTEGSGMFNWRGMTRTTGN
ncbi:chromosome segregation protein [Pannonibacter phragmitetus]|uniref:Chromosome segregation protein n=1 Tax=Pannonibacter phragmitetus TaxID=121719 RepID=A0A378ZVF4_9HYPH|nr:AAA family ATPase [Pannonibacter phragmitetus]SUB00829.1 chromosome segregation protein [Pannonibacter phragmitetus]